jgi:CheY-like chemotaxis protein
MDPGTLEHIFDPFFTTKETGQGTGLGLATVYGIVQQNGGTIAVESSPGAGARFTIHLPRADEREAEAPAPSDAETPRRGTEIILLVEDQERLRDAIGVVLRGYGYEVIEAGNADDALALVEAFPGPIHLLLTDVVMPRTSGPVLAERVGRIRPGIKVVFMSGYAAEAMGQHGSLGGAVLLRKPFEPSELAKVIGAALGG